MAWWFIDVLSVVFWNSFLRIKVLDGGGGCFGVILGVEADETIVMVICCSLCVFLLVVGVVVVNG